ncbi:MAG TPA: hypothetical protein VK400_05220 [Pyrinomonadaceae bacterium]|nr:hypothetical protein [Pyrinomonadaceae bacterium]
MSENAQFSRNMTAVRILESPGTAQIEVAFLESAQFYLLSDENPAFERILAALRDAMNEGRAVEVRLASISSNIIEDVEPAA